MHLDHALISLEMLLFRCKQQTNLKKHILLHLDEQTEQELPMCMYEKLFVQIFSSTLPLMYIAQEHFREKKALKIVQVYVKPPKELKPCQEVFLSLVHFETMAWFDKWSHALNTKPCRLTLSSYCLTPNTGSNIVFNINWAIMGYKWQVNLGIHQLVGGKNISFFLLP